MTQHSKRSQHFIQLIIFTVLFMITALLLFLFPFSKIINPKPINDFTTLKKRADTKYVQLTIPTLYYSGFDYEKNHTIKGHYYYALENDTCLFLLIESQENTVPKETLSSVEVSCKLIDDEQLLTDLSTSMSKQINWTRDGLLSITCPYIASALHYPTKATRFILIFLSVQVIFYLLGGLYHLYHLIKH